MEKNLRLITYISLAVIVLSAGLLAIPYFLVPIQSSYGTVYSPISGYQFFFNAIDDRLSNLLHPTGVSGLGIASIVLMVLALASFIFARKSSALSMLGGLLNVATSVLFFAMEASKNHVYGAQRSFINLTFMTYVIGALLVLSGLASIYFSFRSMQQEKKQIASKQSYSYLKK